MPKYHTKLDKKDLASISHAYHQLKILSIALDKFRAEDGKPLPIPSWYLDNLFVGINSALDSLQYSRPINAALELLD